MVDDDEDPIPVATVMVNHCPTLDIGYPIPVTANVVIVNCRPTLLLSMQPQPPGKGGHRVPINWE